MALRIVVLHGATGDRPDEIDTLRTAKAVARALTGLGHEIGLEHLAPDMAALGTLRSARPDLVFNLVEAIGGEAAPAAEIPALLDALGLAHTGCRVNAMRACMSKLSMKRTMAAAGLPTPAWSEDGHGLAAFGRVIVKADTEHASLGIDAGAVVPGAGAAEEMRHRARLLGLPVFAEAFIDGREFNIALLGGPGEPEVLPPAEILFVDYPEGRPKIVDYEAKWEEGSFAYANTPRRFDFGSEDAPLLALLRKLAVEAWRLFGLSGYARVDFRVDEAGRPWILEVNTNPCIAENAGFFAAARHAGLDYPQMIARIVRAAPRRREAA